MYQNKKITDAILEIANREGESIFHNSKKFLALLNDLIPECISERKIFQRALSDSILVRFLPLYKGEVDDTKIALMRIEKTIADEFLLSEEFCSAVTCSFAVAFGWEFAHEEKNKSDETSSKPSKQLQKMQDKNPASKKQINEAKAEALKPFIDENKNCIAEQKQRELEKVAIKKMIAEEEKQSKEELIEFVISRALCYSIFFVFVVSWIYLFSGKAAFVTFFLLNGALTAALHFKFNEEAGFLVLQTKKGWLLVLASTLASLVSLGIVPFSVAAKKCIAFKPKKLALRYLNGRLEETEHRLEYLKNRSAVLSQCRQSIEKCQTISDIENEGVYSAAIISVDKTAQSYLDAAQQLQSISGYKDADAKAEGFLETAKYIEAQEKSSLDLICAQICEAERRKEAISKQWTSLKITEFGEFFKTTLAWIQVHIIIFIAKIRLQIVSKKGSIHAYLSSHKVGDTLSFGHFPQHNFANSKYELTYSALQWKVLEKKNGRMLLVSKKSLMRCAFSMNGNTWDGCDIQNLLNGDFLSKAFSEKERSYIVPVCNPLSTFDPGNGAEETIDRCFCLSLFDLQTYLPEKEDLYAPPTGCIKNKEREAEYWWTRTANVGKDGAVAAVLATELHENQDAIGTFQKDSTGICIRPAMWVNIET